MFSQITLLGRCGDDASLRYTPSGKAVASFSLAVDKGFGDKKTTTWIRIAVWGDQQAENAAKLITKGVVVLVVGDLEDPRTYQAKDGSTRVSLEVTARTWRLVGNVAGREPQGISVDDSEPIPF